MQHLHYFVCVRYPSNYDLCLQYKYSVCTIYSVQHLYSIVHCICSCFNFQKFKAKASPKETNMYGIITAQRNQGKTSRDLRLEEKERNGQINGQFASVCH